MKTTIAEQNPRMEWDVFLSHAAEDKEAIARPLANALRECGLRVWFDEFTLTIGDRLHRSINHGLSHSHYGIVIISPAFISKQWPQKELEALASREDDGRKVILPVWHNITASDLRCEYPLLADRLAVTTDQDLDHIVYEILRGMGSEKNEAIERARDKVQFEYTARICQEKLYANRETFEMTVALHVPEEIRRFIRHVKYFPPNNTWGESFGKDADENNNFIIVFRGWGAPTVPAQVVFTDGNVRDYYIRHNWESNMTDGLKWEWGDETIRSIGVWDTE